MGARSFHRRRIKRISTMRYLIFGDVHGNLPALETLLKLEKDNYDQIISHGDVVNYGPWSNECVDLLYNLENIICLRGNHEDNYISGNYSGTNEVAKKFFDICYPGFDRFDLIRQYKERVSIENFEVVHTINNMYIFPDTDWTKFELSCNYIIGHSHYQFDRFKGNRRLINTGSVGQNRKEINKAQYIIYDNKLGLVQLKSFNYNYELVLEQMKSENYPEICINYYKSKIAK